MQKSETFHCSKTPYESAGNLEIATVVMRRCIRPLNFVATTSPVCKLKLSGIQTRAYMCTDMTHPYHIIQVQICNTTYLINGPFWTPDSMTSRRRTMMPFEHSYKVNDAGRCRYGLIWRNPDCGFAIYAAATPVLVTHGKLLQAPWCEERPWFFGTS